ncbi:MAG: recombinase family protein, partial [Eubacteriales bacterium]
MRGGCPVNQQIRTSDDSESVCNAVIYARYSSHRQNEASIEQQVEVCKKYASDNNIRVIAVYSDHALTGTTDRRPEFLRMIKDSAKEKWNKILVYKIDRFARNRYDSATYKSKLKKHGVSVTSVMEPIPDGPEGILLESILEGSAEYYSANLSQNVKRGMYDNAKSCKVNNGVLPLGYRKSVNGLYEIDPPGAQTVKEIFSMYGDGIPASASIQTLNAEGRKTSVGNKFTINSLHSILKNERYTGVYIWGSVRIEDGIPAIITKEEFDRVQRKIKKRAQAPASSRSQDD